MYIYIGMYVYIYIYIYIYIHTYILRPCLSDCVSGYLLVARYTSSSGRPLPDPEARLELIRNKMLILKSSQQTNRNLV